MTGASLFAPFTTRGLTVDNRLWLSPMCQYSAVDGVPGDWHLVHLGARASGGFGLIFTESTAVLPEGRITAADTGLWNDEQEAAWARIVAFVHERGAPIGVQLGHAGRKASIPVPWSGQAGTVPREHGGWQPLSAGTDAYPGFARPRAATHFELAEVVRAFADSARRAVRAGFDVVEILAGHGFLLHSFLSPLTNTRDDAFGLDRELLLLRVVDAVREAIGHAVPLFVRLSTLDWVAGGITVEDSAGTARALRELGVDLVDASSGGLVPADIPLRPGYQLFAAERTRAEAGIPTGAVGLITDPFEADRIVREGRADVVSVARQGLRDPAFALRAAHELGAAASSAWQPQYERAAWA
ncbi:MAG: NADH:flavin oxidoreductase/NADH oxidase [Pseudoclavibacter sp.]